jgi:hypothetical protein
MAIYRYIFSNKLPEKGMSKQLVQEEQFFRPLYGSRVDI